MSNLSDQAEPPERIIPGDESIGILADETSLPCQVDEFKRSMRPAVQLMLTKLIVYSFLENVFAADTNKRIEMRDFLISVMPDENPEVIVQLD